MFTHILITVNQAKLFEYRSENKGPSQALNVEEEGKH